MANAAATIQLSGMTFNTTTLDATGARWFVTIEGWESGQVKAIEEEAGAQDGNHFGGGFLGAKDMTLKGHCKAGDFDGLKASRENLLYSLGRPDGLTQLRQNDATPAYAEIYRVGELLWTPLSWTLADFAVGVRAPKGIRESVAQKTLTLTGGSGTANNAGNHDAWPTLTVVGPATGPIVLTNTRHSRALTITGALTGGQTLTVTTNPKGITINGTSAFDRRDPSSLWPYIENGNNAFTYSGGGTATLAWRDTWR